jgi:hypothetical protein
MSDFTCEKCERQPDELWWYRVKCAWWCEHCMTLTGEKVVNDE